MRSTTAPTYGSTPHIELIAVMNVAKFVKEPYNIQKDKEVRLHVMKVTAESANSQPFFQLQSPRVAAQSHPSPIHTPSCTHFNVHSRCTHPQLLKSNNS